MKFIGWMVPLTTLALIGLSGCGGGQNKPIAKIGDKIISQDEYLKRTEKIPTPVGILNNQIATQPAGYNALLQMVREEVLTQMAQQEGVMPTDQQVEERVQRLMQQNPEVKRAVTEQKTLTLDDLRRQVRLNLIQFNLLTKGVTVTEKEIQEYYEKNKRNFYRPATALVQLLVVTNPETRNKIDEDLRKGLNFRSVAQKYAQNPVAGVQASETELQIEPPFANNPQGQVLAQIANVLKPLKAGEISQWVPAGNNTWARFYVITKSSGRQLPYDEVKERIREILMMQKGQQTNRDINEEIAKRLLETKVEIYHEQWKEQYTKEMENLKKSLEELQKQKKQATSPSSGQGTR